MDGRLGLTYGEVELATDTRGEWPREAERLADALRAALGDDALGVEHIGSTSVPGLLAKPILDFAARLAPAVPLERVIGALEPLGYIYRGDAGDEGGLIFVLEDAPLHRIAHVHGIRDGDPQWDRYLALRARLRADPKARKAYGDLKRRLAAEFPHDRKAYQSGKSAFVTELLRRGPAEAPPRGGARAGPSHGRSARDS